MHIELLIRYLTIRKKIREDLFFLAHLLGYDLVVKLMSDYHQVAVYNRRNNNFTLTEMPRGTFKTTVFTIIETIQDILINPCIRILIGHFAGANARAMLDELQNHFIVNDDLRNTFPDICPQNTKRPETGNWTGESITVKRSRHYKEGTVEALGSDQAMASNHYDKIKLDDITVEASSTTVDQIKKATTFLIRSYSLLNNHNPDRNLSITGTEWVPDDTMVKVKNGEILAPDGKPYNVFRIPAESSDGPDNTRRSLFPDILPLDVLDGLRASQRTTYHAFYLLDAEEFEDQVWNKNQIQWYDTLPPDRTYRIIGSVDPSITETDIKNNCDTAIPIIAKDNLNELWVLDYILGHGVDIIYTSMFSLHKKWKAERISYKNESGDITSKPVGDFRFFSIETTLFQKLIYKELRRLMSEQNYWIPVRESKPIKEKFSRIQGALDPLITNKAFHVKRGMHEIETQLIRFGRPGQKVDLLDAIAQAELESNIAFKKGHSKKIEEEYKEMYANAHVI